MNTPPPWYVVNVADAPTVRHALTGTWTRFEAPEAPFSEVGINLRMLEPGQPSTKYHAENAEETFLVLSGRCLAIVGGQKRELGPWDLLHCPPGVPHALVGAGEGPCAILMIGGRHPEMRSYYPFNALAAEHGASAPESTEDPAVAYGDWRDHPFEDAALEWPPS